MMKSPFSYRSEGPRTDAERAILRDARKRENTPPPTPEGFEHIATIKDVRDYLVNAYKGDASKADICQYPIGCDINALEPLLLDKLIAIKASDTPDENAIRQVRALIRAASCLTHSRPIASKLIPLAESLVQDVEAHQKKLARTEPEEAKDWDEIRAMTFSVTQALKREQKGAEAEAAACGIEYVIDRAYQEKKDPKELKKLRELRDQIYFQRLYPTWFAAGTEGLKSPRAPRRS